MAVGYSSQWYVYFLKNFIGQQGLTFKLGLGAGGQVDSKTSANSNAALYSTFSVTAFFAG
jgi:hypothetical protein